MTVLLPYFIVQVANDRFQIVSNGMKCENCTLLFNFVPVVFGDFHCAFSATFEKDKLSKLKKNERKEEKKRTQITLDELKKKKA